MPSPRVDKPVSPTDVEVLFHAAVELPPGDREPFLRVRCGSDDALLQAVLRLLRADAMTHPLSAESALALEARDTAEAEDSAARCFGHYRAIERLGAGGMGVVYKAVRDDDEYRKTVAVKVLPIGFESQDRVERFRRERQILATLDHPNVARLLDGGATEDGLPYLVMECVDGIALNEFAAANGLSLEDRLRLFLPICAAVQFAHRNLIVHCDLKPSNVLVTTDGVPKLLDFGIAKLLDDARRESAATAALMTPEFASPEQRAGKSITTASDVYSLGALLRAFAGETLPRDVRSIVEMAMRAEPDRRYATVEDLAADIRRYLRREPVAARHGNVAYRAGRFLRRNRAIVTVAVVALLVLGIAARSIWMQTRRAERRFHELHRLAQFLLFDTYDAIVRLPNSTELRRAVVAQSQAYLDSLAIEPSDDRTLTSDLVEAYVRLGMVQGYPGTSNIGDTGGALESFRKGREILDRALGRWNDSRLRTEYGVLYAYQVPVLLRAGRWDNAVELGRKFSELAAATRKERLNSPQSRYFEANGRYSYAHALLERTTHTRSVTEVREALAVLASISGELTDPAGFPPDLFSNVILTRMSAWNLQADAHLRLGDWTHDPSHYAAAVDEASKRVAAAREWTARDPRRVDYQLALGEGLNTLGRCLARVGRSDESATAFRQALSILQPAAAQDLANIELQQMLAGAYKEFALAMQDVDRPRAKEMANRSAAIYREVAGHDRMNLEARDSLAAVSALLH
jgi:eukaryotic-like serine/threonine-protein kinase